MMRKEIKSRSVAIFLQATVVLFLMLLQSAEAIYQPKSYMVGDDEGWSMTLSIRSWTNGKHFFAGDILGTGAVAQRLSHWPGNKASFVWGVFQYDYRMYNVAVVDEAGYESCTVKGGAKVFSSGYNEIQLVLGLNYFIDSSALACDAGMRLAIDAAPPM